MLRKACWQVDPFCLQCLVILFLQFPRHAQGLCSCRIQLKGMLHCYKDGNKQLILASEGNQSAVVAEPWLPTFFFAVIIFTFVDTPVPWKITGKNKSTATNQLENICRGSPKAVFYSGNIKKKRRSLELDSCSTYSTQLKLFGLKLCFSFRSRKWMVERKNS